ncbi:MAG: hypothetical protein KKI13_04290 [Candidatus Omnitrophica bacterium]|nr:hypothetical protein [Candidatus Omnitrophota bacterium]
MTQKFVIIIIIAICTLFSPSEIKAEILNANTTVQGITFPKGTDIYFYKSGKPRSAIIPYDQVIQGIPCAKGTIWLYESGKLKNATLAQNEKIQGIVCAKNRQALFHESGKLTQAILAGDQKIQGILFNDGTEVCLSEEGRLLVVVLAQEQEIQQIPCAKGSQIHLSGTGKLEGAVLAKEQVIQGILCAKAPIELYESGKLKKARLAQDQEIQGIRFIAGSDMSFTESGALENAKLVQAQEIQGIKFIKGSRINFDDSGKILLSNLERSPDIQGIICEKGSIELYESGKLKSGRLLRDQNVQGVQFPRGTGIHLLESGELMSVWLGQDYEKDGIKFARGNSLSFYKSGKISSGVLSGDQIVQNIPCAKGAITLTEAGKLTYALLSQDAKIDGILCAKNNKLFLYESGKLKQATLAQNQDIQDIPCAKGEVEFYESGKLKNCILAQDKELQGVRCFKDSKISLSDSGKLDSDTLTVQKYLKEYDNVTIKFSVPKFLENNRIACLKTINCWNIWGKKASLKEIKIVEINLKDPQEKILFQIAPKAGTDRWEFDDFPRFDINPKGQICILEPALDFSNPEAMKITIINLTSKETSTITRRGTNYRISPNGKFMIYGDVGNSSNNYSDKKTLYLTDIRGTSREAVYETQDSILSFCWINEETIAVYCDSKEGPYVKFVDTQTKGILDSIVSEYYKGSILVSSDGSAIILDDNKLFVKKDATRPLLKTVQNLPYLNSNERLNGINKKWNCYTIIARYIAISSWSPDNEFTVGSNLDGNLLLTDFKTFETKVLKRGYKKY